MPRPRLHRLAPEQQRAILDAARDEFAAHGFAAASLNRIIEAAKISKGSMYYYFDDKADLYAHVVSIELGHLFDDAGPFPIPTDREPDAFWSTLESYALRILNALAASAQRAAIARDWVVMSESPTLQRQHKAMEQTLLPWFQRTMDAGQKARAVRKDVPIGLLIAIAFGMGAAMDRGLLTQQPIDAKSRRLVMTLMDMFRRALAP